MPSILCLTDTTAARLPRPVQEPPQTGRNLRDLAGTHQLSTIPQAPELLRFDAWPRHWAIGLKTGQNHILSYPVRKLGFAKPLAKAKSPPATAMDGL
ncbi:hypothetical protein SINU_12975, partial [Sporolactobacillus inulinus CASD]